MVDDPNPEQASGGRNGATPGRAAWPEAASLEAAALDRLFAGASAEDLIAYAVRDLAPGRAAVVSSFGADSVVLLHLVSRVAPDTPVLFIDTAKHFAETLAYRDTLAERLGLVDIRSVTPQPGRLAALDPDGDLHRRDADLCCRIRKQEPLETALAGFDLWINGRRRDQTADREAMPLVERDGDRLKINPLAGWAASEIAAYRTIHALPRHPLSAKGYLSVGCAPCTSPVADDEDARAGRWRGRDKTECGIHIARNGETVRVLRPVRGRGQDGDGVPGHKS
ncbi:phosphoadenylyl-sulfate reductase [Microbaculum marinisediminis]|uniref:Adenosine 5'-phosphosulfate reductase n=1 Tax=Microbaculum marinisediminis TaxID=2931392 RepID=A0AAW5QYX2_9HYPH|nr:phosphoadenylyl-sulfate reductase [Microbaculum sp. A6E488]MCT8972774.1 phosphoadenylyl-sulfate reductase [Microbaculum sp. A6E488]